MFDAEELDAIAELCVEHDLLAVTDEVYEHLVFDGRAPSRSRRSPACATGRSRSPRPGKTFSFTGWKVGWVCGRRALVTAVRTAKQFLTYVSGAPFQHAVAVGLALADDYFARVRAPTSATSATCSSTGCATAGFEVFPPAGTYFVTADIRSLGESDGLAFCRSLPERCGVVAVPNVVFYDDQDAGRPLVRFAFCKRREVLDEAVTRLKALSS